MFSQLMQVHTAGSQPTPRLLQSQYLVRHLMIVFVHMSNDIDELADSPNETTEQRLIKEYNTHLFLRQLHPPPDFFFGV